jgi:hypothetical protein
MTIRKRQGEWAELAFMLRASALGFTVSKPLGESARYDVIIEKLGRASRVQVKSASSLYRNEYRINTATGADMRRYTAEHADFIAAYVVPEDAWYIFPIAAVTRFSVVYLRPHRPTRCHWEHHREAWHLLEPEAQMPHASPPLA